MSIIGKSLARLSEWIDNSNKHRDAEAVTWGRLAKIMEEGGEVIAAYIGYTGQNPRKGVTHSKEDVMDELLDVAVTALGAWEHLDGNEGNSGDALLVKLDSILNRANIGAEPGHMMRAYGQEKLR
jgi:hypothetical protein